MIELRAGRLRCELRPELGGAVAGLWRDAAPVLRSTPAAELTSARLAACFPLVPFSNRGHAEVVWDGTQQPQVRHAGDPPHAIHGIAWQRPWAVLDSDDTSAMLAYEQAADASWPFAFDCSHTVRLLPDALELTLALTNQASRIAPVGFGWRATLARRGRVAFRAGGKAVDEDCASLVADHCHEGWDGLARFGDAGLQVRLRSELTRLVLAASPGQDFVTLSPVSHVPNAVRLEAHGVPAAELGLAMLQPGESLIAQMRIEVEVPA